MLVTSELGNVETSGVLEQASFTVQNSPKMFKMLISTIYSRKIEAIVRELSTNAYDAHKMAGNLDRPFVIHLPTVFDATFSVRDYGVSMTHEQIMGLYATLGGSSKDKDNFAVGKFGLGSKTPFAYTDTFNVTAILDGRKRVYNAFIDAEGTPQIALFHMEETEEERGIEISFPVAESDIRAFKDAAQIVLIGFDYKPIVNVDINGIDPNNIIIKGENWINYTIRSSTIHALTCHRFWVKQGCVLYPVDQPNYFKNNVGMENAYALMQATYTIIDMPIGSVDITPSRESISYDQRTIENITNAIVKFLAEHKSAILNEIKNAKSFKEAGQLYDKFYYNIPGYTAPLKNNAKWRGHSVIGNVVLDTKFTNRIKDLGCEVLYFGSDRYDSDRYRKIVDIENDMHLNFCTRGQQNMPIIAYYIGEKKPLYLRLRLQKLINYSIKLHGKKILLLPNFNPNSEGFKRLVTRFYDKDAFYSSLIDLDTMEEFRNINYNGLYASTSMFKESCWERNKSFSTEIKAIDQETVVYVRYSRGNNMVLSGDKTCTSVQINRGQLVRFIADCQKLLGSTRFHFVGISNSAFKRFKETDIPENWISFYDFVNTKIIPLIDFKKVKINVDFKSDYQTRNKYQKWEELVRFAYRKDKAKYQTDLFDDFWQFMQQTQNINDETNKIHIQLCDFIENVIIGNHYRVDGYQRSSNSDQQLINKAKTLTDILCDKYPFVNKMYFDTGDVLNNYIDLINQIDRLKEKPQAEDLDLLLPY